jgi:hypothetical protein
VKRALIVTAAALAATAALLGGRLAVRDAPLDRLALEAGGESRTGSWHFPRGGPYVLAFQCRTDCELAIDGRVVARGRGLQRSVRRKPDDMVYEAGVHAVRLRGDARLLWHPPGRRGNTELEYVPASSLSPEPPEAARFDSGAGAAVLDGLVAALLLGVWLGWGLALAWPSLRLVEPRQRLRTWAPAAVVLTVALAARLWGLGDAGQTWDEDVNWSAGKNYVTNVLELDFAPESWIWNLEHPPVMKLLVGVGAQLADGYGPARAISAAMMAIACALLVPIGRRLTGAKCGWGPGFYAGVFAALSPHLIGHGQIVGHESAAALWWTLGILVALRVAETPPGRWHLERRLAAAGVVLGLAIFSRFASGLLGPLLYAVVVIRAPGGRRLETAWKAAAILPLIALAVGFVLWPRLWSEPVTNLLEAWARLKNPHGMEPFLGEMTNRPPLYYFVTYLVATAPVGLLVAALVGMWRLVERRDGGAAVLGLWLLIPLAIMVSPVRQDGVRYVIPSLFALAMLGGLGVARLGELAARWIPRRPVVIGAALAAGLALYLAIAGGRARPYTIDYYNELTGGPERVARERLFEIAWWGEGLAAAIEWVNREAPEGARIHKACIAPSHLAWLRADLWGGVTGSLRQADWMIIYAPLAQMSRRCAPPEDMELVFEEDVMGAPLVRVYRRTATR